MLNRQLVFDDVAKHLLTQRKICAILVCGEESCRYRYRGLKCAVGCLIPDDRYSEELEGTPPYRPSVLNALDPKYGTVSVRYPDDDGFFLSALQNVHDKHDSAGWGAMLKMVARKYQLSPNIVDTIDIY